MIEAALETLARANLAGGAAVLAVLAARPWMRRRFGAGAAYALWLAPALAAAASLAPPLPATAMPIDFSTLPTAPVFDAALDAAPRIDVWPAALLALWLAGAAASLVLLGLRQAAFLADVRRGVAGPALVGLLRPRIVTPAGFEREFSAEERELILAHEATHLSRGDTAANALAAAILCACWFNPLVHLAARLMRIDQELACDAAVLSARPDARRVYAETLLKTQVGGRVAPFGCAWPSAAQHPLKERIAMLKSPLPSRRRRAQGVAAVAALSLVGAAGAWAAQPGAAPKLPEPRAVSPQVVLADPTAPADLKLFAKTAIEGPAPKPIITRTPPGKVSPRQITTGSIDFAQTAMGEAEAAALGVVTDPVWLERPTGTDVAQVMPEAIRRQPNLQGRVRMACLVEASGQLSGCRVLKADYTADALEFRPGDPPGLGLDVAALELSKRFRMAPQSRGGVPTSGKQVIIPIRFATTPPPTPST